MKLKAHERTARRWLVALAALLAIAFLASFYFGRYGVAPGKVVGILLSRFFSVEADWTPQMQTAVLNIRLPRILAACHRAFKSANRDPIRAIRYFPPRMR